MLDPYHRLPLKELRKTSNSTVYTASFTTPDQWGIFSFRVNYKRPFMSHVEVKEEVTIRHFAHDEYDRSYAITGAWVWIAGVWVTIAGFLAFVAVWLYAEPSETIVVKKKQ
jgi:oligosaccharyltransferase complex subunit beta